MKRALVALLWGLGLSGCGDAGGMAEDRDEVGVESDSDSESDSRAAEDTAIDEGDADAARGLRRR